MAVYSELIKNFEKIRDYVRDFYIFGFRTRDDYDSKSRRTYDNEKRRIESWLSDHIHSSRNGHRKSVAVKIDSSRIYENPLYKCYRSKSFTDNDIRLHFILMDILDGDSMTVTEITDRIVAEYRMVFDQQIVRLKLKEYTDEGLLTAKKQGSSIVYSKSEIYADELLKRYNGLGDMIKFFSEEIPFGVVGNFLLKKSELVNSIFTRKHCYMVHTLDDEVLMQIIWAMKNKCDVTLNCISIKNRNEYCVTAVPVKIHSSVQTGRNYIIMYNEAKRRFLSVRLDTVKTVSIGTHCADFDEYCRFYKQNACYLWGTSFGDKRKYGQTEHIHMELVIDENAERFVVDRLIRESRGGTVTRLSEGRYAFDTDLFDANEASPWIKTFIGRIAVFETANKEFREKFLSDMRKLERMYGGDGS